MKRITTLFVLILSFILFNILPIQATEFYLVADGDVLLTDENEISDNDEIFMEEDDGISFGTKLAITIIVPLVIAGLVCFIFLGQMKTAVPQRAADNYIPNGGFNLTNQEDKFLYTTETRTPIKEKSSNGSTSKKK